MIVRLSAVEIAASIRSFVYVPGDRPDRIDKAAASAADVVLIDLEDAVALAAKPAARIAVGEALQRHRARRIWVRINADEEGRTDLESIAGHADLIEGLLLAKCERTTWIDEVTESLTRPVPLAALIESARGVRTLDEICAHPQIVQCHLGEIDLTADLGGRGTAADRLIEHARVELVYASIAAGIAPPIGGVHVDIDDVAALVKTSRDLRDLGFGGRPAIHPSQIAAINDAFSPTLAEMEAAVALVAMYDAALARGTGAIVDASGRMIDEAVVRASRRLVERSAAPHSPTQGST